MTPKAKLIAWCIVGIPFVLLVVTVCYWATGTDALVHYLPPMSISTVSKVLTGEYPDHVRKLAEQVLHSKRSPQELRGAIDLWDALQKRTEIAVEIPIAPEIKSVKPGQIIKVKIPEIDAETALDLAMCIRAESDTHKPDYAPIAFTLLRRMTLYNIASKRLGRKLRSYRDQVRAYCQIFNRNSHLYNERRRVNIRSSTFDDPQHGKVDEWLDLEGWINNWEIGAHSDPCPSALIWGGKEGVDPIPGGWVQVACKGASNRFMKRSK